MRFADEYVGKVLEETARFQRTVADPELRKIVAGWSLSQANSAYTTAAGESAVVSALDLVTLAVLSRMVIEDSVVPRFPSESAPLLAMHRQLEEEAWELTDDFLTESQIQDFHDIVAKWRARNPRVSTSVVFVHFLDFASEIGRPAPGEAARRGNLFGLIGLDPLAGLDPAVRQIEQTRLLAERMIYYLQRVPYVVSLQVDRMTSDLLVRPEVRELLADTDRVSHSVERFAGVAEDLPATFARERQARSTSFRTCSWPRKRRCGRCWSSCARRWKPVTRWQARSTGSSSRSIRCSRSGRRRRPVRPDRLPASLSTSPNTHTPPPSSRAPRTSCASCSRRSNAQAPALASTVGSTIDQGRSLIDYLALRVAALIAVLIGGTLAATLAYRYLAVRMKT